MRTQGADEEHDFDAITIGETMAAFLTDGAPHRYVATAVGAESNVAAGMAQLGCRTRWVSRLGDDDLGRLVHDTVASYGVDVCVEWDSHYPTGLLLKELGPEGTRIRYYRTDSAARRLGRADLRDAGSARWLHVTGITAALSDSAADLVAFVCDPARHPTTRVSFDVNYRPALWDSAEAAGRVILPLARCADIVFIGDDEADALLGSADASEIGRQLLVREGQEVVVKRGAGRASVLTVDGEVSEPALSAAVVDLTGAGDAFAAGYIAGTCWGWSASYRLRLGHFLGARAVGELSDQGPPLTPEELSQLRASPATLAPLWASEKQR